MKSKQLLWYLLLFLQIFIYSFYFISYLFDDYSVELFIFSMCTSASLSYVLNFQYFSFKKNKVLSKKDYIISIIISWLVSLLLILPILLFGYIMIVLFLVWFLFTLIFIGIKYIFKNNQDD